MRVDHHLCPRHAQQVSSSSSHCRNTNCFDGAGELLMGADTVNRGLNRGQLFATGGCESRTPTRTGSAGQVRALLSRAAIPAVRAMMRCSGLFRCIHVLITITTLLPLATDWQQQVVSSGAMRERDEGAPAAAPSAHLSLHACALKIGSRIDLRLRDQIRGGRDRH